MKSIPCELFLLGYVILQMVQWTKLDPERMKADIEATRNKRMGSYKASRVCISTYNTGAIY
jgi:hypothetical protein